MLIYLAGGETWNRQFKLAGISNRLFSFYYLRRMRNSAKLLNELAEEKAVWAAQGKRLRLFLDSGAFTYQDFAGRGKDKDEQGPSRWMGNKLYEDKAITHVAPETYLKQYRDFLARTKDLWDCAAEFDIENNPKLGVDLHQVDAWREELLEAVQGGRTLIIPVWHDTRGVEAWQNYCDDPRYPYLGIGSGFRDSAVGAKNKLCAVAHRAGKVVHGFAETKLQTEAKYLEFDSVDSTTWLRATKYGGMFVFHANQLRILSHLQKDQRKLFKNHFKALGLDVAVLLQDEKKLTKGTDEYNMYQEELTRASLIAWRNLSARYERMSKRKMPDEGGTNGHTRASAVRGREPGESEAAEGCAGPDHGEGDGAGPAVVDLAGSAHLPQRGGDRHSEQGHHRGDTAEGRAEDCAGSGSSSSADQGHDTDATYPPNLKFIQLIQHRCGHYSAAWPNTTKEAPDKVSAYPAPAADRLPRMPSPNPAIDKKQAMRQTLLDAGFEPTDVDAALPIQPLRDAPRTTLTVEGKTHLPVLNPATSSVYPEDVEIGLRAKQGLLGYNCSDCGMSENCPKYEEGASCAFQPIFSSLSTRDLNAHSAIVEDLLDRTMGRVQMAMMIERTSGGGQIDPRVTQLSVSFMDMLERYREMRKGTRPATFKATMEVSGSPAALAKAGPLSRLFSAALPAGDEEFENEPGTGRDVIIEAQPECKEGKTDA